MRRLTITGFCAIALLSGCAGPQPKVDGETNIGLPCKGKDVNTGEWDLAKIKQTVVFHTDGRCKFTAFSFDGHAPPQGPPDFTQQPVVTLPSATITYVYDGQPISSATGYTFKYENDYSKDGNGSGVVKN